MWTTVSAFVRGTDFHVTGLSEGRDYKFRVRAANEFGPGEPLDSERPITAVDPVGKCF